MELTKNKIMAIAIAIIFGSSAIVVLVTGSGLEKNQAVVVVDMGQNDVYRGKVSASENETALKALSGFAYSVDIKNGKIECIANYCNTNQTEWNFYKVEETKLGPMEKEVNQSIEKYQLSNGETIVFRYESIK